MNKQERKRLRRLVNTWERLSDFAEERGDDRLAEGLRYAARALRTQVENGRYLRKPEKEN